MGTLGAFAERVLGERRRVLRRAWRRLGEDGSPTAVHDLRVALRRLQAAVGLLAPVAELPRRLRPRRIGRVVRRLGPVRDADADVSALARVRDGLDPDGLEELEALEDRLGAELFARDRRLARLLDGVLPSRVRRLDRALRAWQRAPRLRACASAAVADWLPILVLPTVSGLLSLAGWWAGEAAESLPAVHSLRREAKLARYQLDELARAGVHAFAAAHEDLLVLQAALGGLRDGDRLLRSVGATSALAARAIRVERDGHAASWQRLRTDLRTGRLPVRWLGAAMPSASVVVVEETALEDEMGGHREFLRSAEGDDVAFDEPAD